MTPWSEVGLDRALALAKTRLKLEASLLHVPLTSIIVVCNRSGYDYATFEKSSFPPIDGLVVPWNNMQALFIRSESSFPHVHLRSEQRPWEVG